MHYSLWRLWFTIRDTMGSKPLSNGNNVSGMLILNSGLGTVQRVYSAFIVFWTTFELAFMFSPVVYLVDLVVLRSNSAKWKLLKRLLKDDESFASCALGMLSSFVVFVLLQIVEVGMNTLYGGEKTQRAFEFIRTFF